MRGVKFNCLILVAICLAAVTSRAQVVLYDAEGFAALVPGSLVTVPQDGWVGQALADGLAPAVVDIGSERVLLAAVPDGSSPLDHRKESRLVKVFDPPLATSDFNELTIAYDLWLDADADGQRHNVYFDFDPYPNKYLGDGQIVQDNGYVQLVRGGDQSNGSGLATGGWHHLQWTFDLEAGTVSTWFDDTQIDAASPVSLADLIADQAGEDPDGDPTTLDALSVALVTDWWQGPADQLAVDNVIVTGVYPDLLGVDLEPAALRVRVGGSGRVTALGQTAGGSVDVSAAATWSSDTPAIASADGGLVCGVGEGTTTVRASYGGFTGSALVTVEAAAPPLPQVLTPRVLVVSSDPILAGQGDARLHDYAGWFDPSALVPDYVTDLQTASHGWLTQRITRWVDEDLFPLKADGFRYDEAGYLAGLQGGSWHAPDAVDYGELIRHHDLARRIDSGEIDEVLWFGGPYFGFYESRMIGPGGYWCNSPALPRVAVSRLAVIMGLNYERGVAEMLHSTGHRAESILSETYGGWDITQARTDWERFAHNIGQSPDAACGTAHFPPNGTTDYDYANTTPVVSTAVDWELNFPDLTGQTAPVDCASWGGPDYQRGFFNWWYAHMPHQTGSNDHDGLVRLNSWWPYLFDFNRFTESGGEFVYGGPIPVAQAWPGAAPVALTADAQDDWAPVVNAAGLVVWSGYDGNDYEIYARVYGTSGVTALTDNDQDDRAPQVNDAGTVVWQGFDGQDWEIFTRVFGSPTTVRLTDNAYDDRQPQINSYDRVVWSGFDGLDDEIYSANADGGDLTIVSDAGAVGTPPPDDVFPQICDTGRIVWSGRVGDQWDIFAVDADGGQRVNLSDSPEDDAFPALSRDGAHVVWHAWVSDTNAEIYCASPAGGTVTRLTDDARLDWYPQVNAAGRVVWMSRIASGNWDILTDTAAGAGTEVLADADEPEQYPRINDRGQVVWQGFDGVDWEIYLLDDGIVYQVTDNDSHDRWPALGQDAEAPVAVWHAETGATSPATSEIWAVRADPTASAVGEPSPAAAFIARCAPNPFNPRTTITLTMASTARARLDIYDLRGRRVVRLVDGVLDAGRHDVVWTGRDSAGCVVASGVYLVRLAVGSEVDHGRLTLVR